MTRSTRPRRIRALVLAAGLSTRLRPLTAAVPKPLLPVAGLPVLAHTLRSLAAVGCEAAAINLHHHGGQIRGHFGPSYAGLPLTYSEEPRLLGTLGALGPLRDFLAGADLIILVNGDSLCRWPLAELVRRHEARGAEATLLLTSRADPAEFGGGLGIDRRGRIVSLRSGEEAGAGGSGGGADPAGRSAPPIAPVARRLVFAGAHVLSPALLAMVDSTPSDIIGELYAPLLRRARRGEVIVGSLITRRRWHDLGTPSRYLAGVLDWVRSSRPSRRDGWIAPEAAIAATAVVRGASIEAGAVLDEGAVVERSVLLPGARAGAGSQVRNSILGFDVVLPAGSRAEGQMVTASPGGGAPLVTPLGGRWS
ncbi:MAG TPA: NDP-sugar synthase [Thermoanaerobaculia bacterium]|nr:NDP-sugar synthase [Thermoanaerobaculia bacterium]